MRADLVKALGGTWLFLDGHTADAPHAAHACFGLEAVAAAEYLYDMDGEKEGEIVCGGHTYPVRLTVLHGQVLCAWVDVGQIHPLPLEQLACCHGIRGEILAACFHARPRLGVYELGCRHAVFLLESPGALRKLPLISIGDRLCETLFFQSPIRLHFAALGGENMLYLRSYAEGKEVLPLAEDAAAAAYCGGTAELVDISRRTMLSAACGGFCVSFSGTAASVSVKCRTLFFGNTEKRGALAEV